MRIKKTDRMLGYAVLALAVLCLSILFYHALANLNYMTISFVKFGNIIRPFLLGGCVAFVLNLVMEWIEKLLTGISFMKNRKPSTRRVLALACTYLIFILVVAWFLKMVIPQLYYFVLNVLANSQTYAAKISTQVNKVLTEMDVSPENMAIINKKFYDFIQTLSGKLSNLIYWLTNIATGVINTLVNSFLGLIIAGYLLYDKERFAALAKKLLYGIFPVRFAGKALYAATLFNENMRHYLKAQGIDAMIIGAVFYGVTLVLRINYGLVIGFMLGLTNMIPWFGAWIAILPVVILIALESGTKALWFFVTFVVVIQFDGSFLAPKLQGNKLGISPFWVMLAIIVTGHLFGFIGMILGVPLFVVFYQLLQEVLDRRLEKRGLPVALEEYMEKGKLCYVTSGLERTFLEKIGLREERKETIRKGEGRKGNEFAEDFESPGENRSKGRRKEDEE